MKRFAMFGLASAFALSVVTAYAVEMSSGPKAGEQVGAYTVKKVAGNANDGVEVGQDLCYRCKMGNRPVVMVFSRKPDEKLAKLVKKLDSVVAENQDKKLVAFVNLLGDDADALAKAGEKAVEEAKVENVAFVVPKDLPNGPGNYSLNPEAETTVLIYVKGTVAANHALPAGGLTDEAVQKIIDDTAKILN